MLKIINCNNENYRNKLKKYLDSDGKNISNRVKLVSKIIITETNNKILASAAPKGQLNAIPKLL